MTRLVITPWDGKHDDLLEECKASVAESGVEHRVVRCGTDWQEIMFGMRNDADTIAWVDCDDIVYPGAVVAAMDLLEKSGVGLVYTDEALIDRYGKTHQMAAGERTLHALASHPMPVHHLTVTRRHSIGGRALMAHRKHGILLDWAMKVDAAANGGMKHLPMLGYGWRLHGDQMTSNREFQQKLNDNLPAHRAILREWVRTRITQERMTP